MNLRFSIGVGLAFMWCAAAVAGPAPPGVSPDFDDDGFDDLVIGVAENIAGFDQAGAAHVLAGAAQGLTADGSRFLHQNKAGIDDDAEMQDSFGSAMATGDFDGDGFADLVIAVVGEDLNDGGAGEVLRAGAVHVLYGSADGPSGDGSQFLHQDGNGVEGVADHDDLFGSALATGDFDGDGFDDLAVSLIGQDVNGVNFAGAVHVFYGTSNGLRFTNDEVWHLDVPGVKGIPAANDFFGRALAAGDFNGDGADDLAVSSSSDPGGAVDAGSVNVLYGTNGVGLTADGDQLLTQDWHSIIDVAEAGDRFGGTLAAGDFDGDGFQDLVVSAPGEDLGKEPTGNNTGAVHVIFGSDDRLTARNNHFFFLDAPGVPGRADGNDFFGAHPIVAADFNRDDRDDLAFGMGDMDVDGVSAAGAVIVLYGRNSGLGTEGARLFHQDVAGIPSRGEFNDLFGAGLTSGDFDGDTFADLAVGSYETVHGTIEAGAVFVIYGSANGLRGTGAQFFSQDTPGIADTPEPSEHFGDPLPSG